MSTNFSTVAGADRDWRVGQPTPPDAYHARFLKRFWSKVDKTPGLGPDGDCWEWRGSLTAGYGQLGHRDVKVIRAHVASWTLVHGHPAPPKGWHVCHKCNNKPCVREDHLFVGTPKQNTRHAMATGLIVKAKPKPEPIDYMLSVSREQGAILREARHQQGVSLVDLAYVAQLDKSLLSQLERGIRGGCRRDKLIFLLRYLNIDESEFGLAACQTRPVYTNPAHVPKYLSEPPSYVHKESPLSEYFDTREPTWISTISKRARGKRFLEMRRILLAIGPTVRPRKGDIAKATGLSDYWIVKVLAGTAKPEHVERVLEHLKQLKTESEIT